VATWDWTTWHEAYDRPGSELYLRLLVVQDLIGAALDEAPPGPVRVISMCAGQGRDVIGVARRHRRGRDLTGLLVEADPRNAAAARAAIERAGLDGLRVERGDAGHTAAYARAVPADLLLACGIFGNVTDEDIHRAVGLLPTLCAPGARVLWTRRPREDGILATIQGWFAEAGFRPAPVIVGAGDLFGVGSARLATAPPPYSPDREIFAFTRHPADPAPEPLR
jgi:hypothetical protein